MHAAFAGGFATRDRSGLPLGAIVLGPRGVVASSTTQDPGPLCHRRRPQTRRALETAAAERRIQIEKKRRCLARMIASRRVGWRDRDSKEEDLVSADVRPSREGHADRERLRQGGLQRRRRLHRRRRDDRCAIAPVEGPLPTTSSAISRRRAITVSTSVPAGSLLREPLSVSVHVDHRDGTAELELRDQPKQERGCWLAASGLFRGDGRDRNRGSARGGSPSQQSGGEFANERCSGFEVWKRRRNSVQFTLRSTTTHMGNVGSRVRFSFS